MNPQNLAHLILVLLGPSLVLYAKAAITQKPITRKDVVIVLIAAVIALLLARHFLGVKL